MFSEFGLKIVINYFQGSSYFSSVQGEAPDANSRFFKKPAKRQFLHRVPHVYKSITWTKFDTLVDKPMPTFDTLRCLNADGQRCGSISKWQVSIL